MNKPDGFFVQLENETSDLSLLKRDETLALIKKKMVDIEEFLENQWIPTFIYNFVELLEHEDELPYDRIQLIEVLMEMNKDIGDKRREMYGMKQKGEL